MKYYLRKFNHPVTTIAIMAIGVFGIIFGVQAYSKTFGIEAQMDQEGKIDPGASLMVKFSEPMLADKTTSNISIFPDEEMTLRWQDRKTLIVSPQNIWQPGGTYNLSIRGARSWLLTSVDRSFVFEVAGYPEVAEFYPAHGAKDVLLDIEDPILVSFDKSVEDFSTRFTVSPSHELAYEVVERGRKVKLLPKGELERGKRYQVDVHIHHKREDESREKQIYSTYFETKPLPPLEWDKDHELRLEQARKFTDARITTGKYIDINVKSQIMAIFENGKLLDAYLVSTGKRGMDTKLGQFAVYNKFPRAWSKKYGLYMPFWMAMVPSGEFGIHELPEWPGGYKEGKNHLGIPVSHGCIRLGVGPAERVYNWAELKTPVIIHD